MFTRTLSDNAQAALAILGKSNCLPLRTYLAGGSALALHFGHRISVDFDFFTPSIFDSNEISKKLTNIGIFKLDQKDKNTLLGSFNNVKFSLFTFEYPLICDLVSFSDTMLASTLDIAAMKVSAIMNRGTKKDFIDMYYLDKHNITLSQSLDAYDKKYKTFANNAYSLITSLSYFDDAEKTEMPEMLIKTSWEDVKDFFRKEVKKLADIYLK